MILAAMIAKDEDALVCDFSEVYHILDYRSIPPRLAATLASGLSYDSRIKRKISGQRYTSDILLLAHIADSLSTLVWFQTKDGQRGTNRPKSILQAMTEEKKKEEYHAFETFEDFEAARRQIMEN